MSARSILIVDDDAEFRSKVQKALDRAYCVTSVGSEMEFRREFRPYTFDLIILDMRLDSGREGLQLLQEILTYDELQPVIMVSAYGDTDAILDSAELGALMFLHKREFTADLLARMVEAVLQQARVRRHLVALQGRMPKETIGLIGKSPTIRRATELIQRAADNPECIILVGGEPGVGHELVAQAIHDRSRRRCDGPLFAASGLAAWSADPEAVLLGSSRRGMAPRRKGLLELANGGVFFLDRMDALTSGVRALVTEALRTRALHSDAAAVPIPLDVQLVAGTGVEGEGAGAVKGELYQIAGSSRLVEIYLPPLRERTEDIPLIATCFLEEMRHGGRTSARTLSRDVIARFEAYSWPGNLPELRNAVEFGAIKALTDGSEEVSSKHLPGDLAFAGASERGSRRWDYRYHLARAEVALIQRVLDERGAIRRSQLAETLGYTDRFALTRRIRAALEGFPEIAREFPIVSGMFRVAP